LNTEDEEFLAGYEKQIAEAEARGQQGQLPYSAAMFSQGNKQNLVEWQLDFSSDMGNIERSLRNDVIARDPDGNEYWIKNPDASKILLNDLGVSDVIKKILLLINKNKVLSNYSAEQIRLRVRMISHEIRTLIYNNYEAYGMDNEYKVNNYSSLVLDLNDMIESAYLRALNGEERRDLNQARVVNQNEPMMSSQPNINVYAGQNQRKGVVSRMMPWNWGR
jgi:hypothetical protein